MKSIKDLRKEYTKGMNVEEVGLHLRYLLTKELDWDVFLPTLNKNLQRELVWTLDQKRELIWSVFLGRHIPHIALVNCIKDESNDLWKVIDGKQRISTLLGFIKGEFTMLIEGEEYSYDDLPLDYKLTMSGLYLRGYVVNEPYEERLTDQQLENWYNFLNYSGTKHE